MESHMQPEPEPTLKNQPVAIKVFGVGKAGIAVTGQLIQSGVPADSVVGVDVEPESLSTSSAGEKIQLETKMFRGLGSGGDPERGRQMAEEQVGRLKSACDGAT